MIPASLMYAGAVGAYGDATIGAACGPLGARGCCTMMIVAGGGGGAGGCCTTTTGGLGRGGGCAGVGVTGGTSPVSVYGRRLILAAGALGVTVTVGALGASGGTFIDLLSRGSSRRQPMAEPASASAISTER
jgi:hypothetical protein